MKSWKILGTLVLALLLLVSFAVFSTAQDKKQDKTKKTTVKVEKQKVVKTKLNQAKSKCTHDAKKDKISKTLKGKVLIHKEHDCGNCAEANHELNTECEHEKTQCEHEKTEKKTNKEKK